MTSLPPRPLNADRSVESAFMNSSDDCLNSSARLSSAARYWLTSNASAYAAAPPPTIGTATGGVTKIDGSALAPSVRLMAALAGAP